MMQPIIHLDKPWPRRIQDATDGSWGACHNEWFFKLDASSDALDDLAERKSDPKHPVRFMDRINSPDKLTAYLDSIVVSDLRRAGRDNRKELNYSVSALLRTISRGRPANYQYHADLDKTLKQYLLSKWQSPETGYWGAWYMRDAKIMKTDDLSMTFHFVSYLKGNVPHLGKIAMTTYRNRERPYPYGVMEDGTYTNHHNYDTVRLFRYGWPELTDSERKAIGQDIKRMLDWCLSESLGSDGAFKPSSADDSVGDTYYFSVSFLDEVGFFDKQKRFWTNEEFPDAVAIKSRIRQKLASLGDEGYMARNALEKLNANKP